MLPASLRTLSSDEPPHVLALPRPLTLAIFALLPVDARLRCCAVNRAWRALLASPTFWACVDLSISSGCVRFSVPLLRAAVAKAGGQLRALIITGRRLLELERPITTVTTSTRPNADDARRMQLLMNIGHAWSDADLRLMLHLHPCYNLLLEVVAANAATLMELRADTGTNWNFQAVRVLLELLKACPALQIFETSVAIADRDRQAARAMLRNEPPFQVLRLRRVLSGNFWTGYDLAEFCLDIRCHTSLQELVFYSVRLDMHGAMGAVVDACIALRLCKLELQLCRAEPAALPELTRLIAAGALRKLEMDDNCGRFDIFEEAHNHESTRLFVAALQVSAMTKLRFNGVLGVPKSVVEAAAFINARQQ